ncbi:hypothetical protein ZMO02_16500 [Zymomonas mobilis subsp. pomaceae]|nr:hypothetical protein ZMO02_16500 [Zymomonas mobilis subsp. pomaceae]
MDTKQLEVWGRKSSTMASSATKTNTPLVETAQSVTVITRDEMDARGVLNLNQAVRYAAGVTADTRGGEGTRYDLFDLRGFTVPTFLDGLKLQDSPTGFAVAQTDTSRLERVELLKGPASALYGQSSPGGLTAQSSKLPTNQRFYGSVNATGGMFDLYRVDADIGGFVTKDGLVRYRIYGTVNGQHTQLSKTGSRRFSISPSLTLGGMGQQQLPFWVTISMILRVVPMVVSLWSGLSSVHHMAIFHVIFMTEMRLRKNSIASKVPSPISLTTALTTTGASARVDGMMILKPSTAVCIIMAIMIAMMEAAARCYLVLHMVHRNILTIWHSIVSSRGTSVRGRFSMF